MRQQLIQTDRVYSIQRTAQGVVCTVNGQPLPLRLDLWKHSPTGFEFGYGGSGPAQLALAILADCCGDELAIAFHQAFKWAVTPTSAQVAFQLAELVRKVRSRPSDPVVLKQNWEEAYHFLAGDAVTTMSEYGSHAGLTDPARQDTTIAVEVISVLQRSDASYQVRWKETLYENGSSSAVSYWTGLFTTKIVPPTTARAVFQNPLGVYVTSFTWSQEFAGNN